VEIVLCLDLHKASCFISRDVILAIQQHKKPTYYDNSEAFRYTPTHPQSPTSEFSFVTQETNPVERTLPPIPSSSPFPNSDIYSPQSPQSPHSNRPSISCYPVSPSPRSASILDLSKRSVVTQRLDEIEHSRPTAAPRKRLHIYSKNLGSNLERESSACSTGADSLLDFYKDKSSAPTSALNPRLAWTSPHLALIPETSSDTAEQKLQNVANKDTNSPLSTYTAANKGVRLDGLLELLQDQATKHYYHTNELGDQIASLHNEIRGMFAELKIVIGEQPSLEVARFVESVTKSMAGLEHRLIEVRDNEGLVMVVEEKLVGIHTEIRNFMEHEKTGLEDMKQVLLKKVEELTKGADGTQMSNHYPELISVTAGRDESVETVLGNLRPSSMPRGEKPALVDLSELNAKLDSLLEQFRGGINVPSIDTKTAEHSEVSNAHVYYFWSANHIVRS
jgi:hypothetical protein